MAKHEEKRGSMDDLTIHRTLRHDRVRQTTGDTMGKVKEIANGPVNCTKASDDILKDFISGAQERTHPE